MVQLRSAHRARRPIALVAAVMFGIAGCSSGSSSTTSGGAAAGPAAQRDGNVVGAKDAAVGAPQGAPGGAVDQGVAGAPGESTVAPERIIKTAAVTMNVEDLQQAAAKVRAAVAGFGGRVTDEVVNATETPPDPAPAPGLGRPNASVPVTVKQGNFGQITFAVPNDRLDAAIDAISQHGTVLQRTSASQDVTAQYVDIEARVATMKASIERVRALMSQTQNLQQIVELEAQLTNREAALEALQAQLNNLAGRSAMSTLTVVLTTSATVKPVEPDTGFMAGLNAGWKAFLSSLTGLLTVVGAMLPWLPFLALIGWAITRWWRRRMQALAASAPATNWNAAPWPPASAPAAHGEPSTTQESGPELASSSGTESEAEAKPAGAR